MTSEAATSKAQTMRGVPFARHENVRIGFIGIGGRGHFLLGQTVRLAGVEVRAVCDIRKDRAEAGAQTVVQAGQSRPELYTAGDHDYERLCERDDLDLIYIATPWEWHVPMAVAAMTRGKHAAVEVPAAVTLKECWQLVDTSEKTRCHCVMLENCCYDRNELTVLHMIRQGLFGDVLHGEAAYFHDLRGLLFDEESEGKWRRFPHIKRSGNLYPTHGLGPVARYLGIHEGDRFVSMVSMSTRERGLSAWRDAHLNPDDPRRKETYRCGDLNTSLLKTAQGKTVLLQHDVVNPMPYDRLNMVMGSKGIFRDYPPRIYLEGQEGGEEFTPMALYQARYEHPLWKSMGELARASGGHGGMDFLMNYRLIQCLRDGLVPDMDVYDAAAWSAPGPLSDESVDKGGQLVPFPDFTRGHWQSPIAA